MARKSKAIIAYFVGIGAYPDKDHRLSAPAGDVDRMQELVKAAAKRSGTPLISSVLLDAQAKRSDVIRGFDIFDDLHPEDICLFYYSGHGSRIKAPYFLNQSSDLTESLVCQDSRTKNGNDLADKELAFLLKQKFEGQKSRVTLIMDCCHAGSNSRSTYVKNKMAKENNQDRAFDSFLGHEQYQVHPTEKGNRYSVAPAPHLHLAACAPEESAKEMEFDGKPHSIFTHFIFESLTRENQRMSYAQLMNEVRTRAGQFVSSQTPEIQTVGLNPQEKHRLFLDGAWQAPTTSYHIYRDNTGWFLNAGQVDGVTENDYAIIENKKDKFPIRECLMQKSMLRNVSGLEATEMYPCIVKKDAVPTFCFASVNWQNDAFDKSMEGSIKRSKLKNWRYSKDAKEATHFICHTDSHLQIVKKDAYQPQVQKQDSAIISQKIDTKDWDRTAESLSSRINDWEKYHRLLNHRNPFSEIDFDAVQIKVNVKSALSDGQKSQPTTKETDQPIELPQFEVNGEIHCSDLYLEVHNNSDLPLWISGLVYGSGWSDDYEMTTLWEISNRFLQSERIDPGESKTMLDHYDGKTMQYIPFYIWEDYEKLIGNEAESYLQIWVTTEPISTDRMNQVGTPIDVDFFEPSRSTRKSLDPFEPDWQTFSIPILISKKK